MEKLVSTQWLYNHLHAPDLVILDCSVLTEQDASGKPVNKSGRSAYDQGHIPTAGFADLKADLCAPQAEIEFALPTPEAFCIAMGQLGVGNNSRVVLYDNSYSAWAARVWWMLRWVGFDNAAILDGGLQEWIAEGRPLSHEDADHPVRELTPKPRPELIADKHEVKSAIGDQTVTLIDTLPNEFYTGQQTIYARPGHIPTASNLSGVDLLDNSGHYKSLAELAALHQVYDRKQRTITYCGGGILASSNAFVMTLLGFEDVAVYTASLQEWAADPANPMTETE